MVLFIIIGLNSDQTGESSQSSKSIIPHDSSPTYIHKWPGIDILMESYQKYQEGMVFFRMKKKPYLILKLYIFNVWFFSK